MADLRDKRARQIQDAIGEILMQHWDPIGVADVPEARGEYDGYIGSVYRILVTSRSEQELIEFLSGQRTTSPVHPFCPVNQQSICAQLRVGCWS